VSFIDAATLFVAETKEKILAKGLQIATALGVDTTTWSDGDPTLTDFWFISELLELLEQIVAVFTKSGFLSSAEGDWLKVVLYESFGVEVSDATRASCLATLTNAGGGQWTITPGSITAKNTTTGKTFRNVTSGNPGTLFGVGAVCSGIEFVADEPGSASNTAVGELDELVTVMRGVTIANTTVAIAIDEPSVEQQRQLGRDKLGALSPNGPADAYNSVAKNPKLTGTTDITDARTYGDNDAGDVTVYLRGSSGAVTEPVRALAEAAIVKNAVPLTITPAVLSATNKVVPVTYTIWLYADDAREADEIEEAIEKLLFAMFPARPIGGDIIPPAVTGALYRSLIESTIKSVSTRTFRVTVTAPAIEATPVDIGEVLVPGTITATIVKVPVP
jgi:Baseplate J-like protein